MTTFKTPGVYVEEISTFPPSVAEVETAIPAFFGFTEKGDKNVPKRIVSLKEFEESFGKGDPIKEITITLVENFVEKIEPTTKSNNVLYYAMQLFFANGGGPCYITSTGSFAEGAKTSKLDPYKSALEEIAKEDEPTLLVFPDAPFILSPSNYYGLMGLCLDQCVKLGDRFTIVDVIDTGDQISSKKEFRNNGFIADANHAKYAAAYYPYLNTIINYNIVIDEKTPVNINKIAESNPDEVKNLQKEVDKIKTDLIKLVQKEVDTKKSLDEAKPDKKEEAKTDFDKASQAVTDANKKLDEAEKALLNSGVVAGGKVNFSDLPNMTEKQILLKISESGVTLTPCAAIAGVYSNVDNSRGVWKAPANISLNFVKSTATKITDDDQMDLNIDENAGKSINAIRAFKGQGIKVWGARTLDGNDNEWKYINVRRFFNMVEESVKKSTNWAVFEANDSNTWVKVRAMIENYLFVKWRDGAMAGTKPSDAYYVRVGLGQTMTAQDILEGRMFIEIGMAVVRPAEFIILRFSHKLQVS